MNESTIYTALPIHSSRGIHGEPHTLFLFERCLHECGHTADIGFAVLGIDDRAEREGVRKARTLCGQCPDCQRRALDEATPDA